MSPQRKPGRQFEREHAQDQPGKQGHPQSGEERAARAAPAYEHADDGVIGQKGELQGGNGELPPAPKAGWLHTLRQQSGATTGRPHFSACSGLDVRLDAGPFDDVGVLGLDQHQRADPRRVEFTSWATMIEP
jgi:hypothetical protein